MATTLGDLLSLESTLKATEGPLRAPRNIGWGACGTVYSSEDRETALKVAHEENGQLWNDYVMHTRVWEAVGKLGLKEVRVPRPQYYVPANGNVSWWKQVGDVFSIVNEPSIHVPEPKPVLVSERIFPLPEGTRDELIHRFAPSGRWAEAQRSPGNKDCLVRVYLGSKQERRSERFFSLRNFKLYLNQMDEVDMDTTALAVQMAHALATMHWEARVDARDVEFVLGSPPPSEPQYRPLETDTLNGLAAEAYTEPFIRQRAPVCLWLLNFNQCARMSMDEEGVRRAVTAFRVNDPYYPRPPAIKDRESKEEMVWFEFCESYMKVSRRILIDKNIPRHLPGLFLKTIQEHYREKVPLKAKGSET